MKILILGATGRTGKHLYQTALEKGYEVNCLARNISRIAPQEGLHLFEGNAHESSDLRKALYGCDHVLSALNISRTSDFPWARLRTPPNYLSDVMKNLLPLAEDMGVKRVIICSAWGVAETKKDIPFWFRLMIDHSNIGVAYRDHERQEALVAQSSLAWTIVRPVGLVNMKPQQPKESFNNSPKPGLIVSRRSVADFMIDAIERQDLIGKKVVISKS